MKVYKEKGIIIFDFEDGKKASYNMNTGETIGKQGRPVKTLCSALAGYNIDGILNSFEDKKYAEFLHYVRDNFTRHAYRGWGSNRRSCVENLGTLLKYANDHSELEGYIRAGVKFEYNIRTPINEVPKGLLKLCREYNKELNDRLIRAYNAIPNEFQTAFKMEFESLEKHSLWEIMTDLVPCELRYYYGENGHRLLKQCNYDLRSLLKYIDYLLTFEGLGTYRLVNEIGDYANMMRQISDKYEKYPRYFLSTHKIAARNYNRLKHQFDEQNFKKQIKPEYEITHKEYKFFYPRSTQEIKDEAVQQHNCVASYIDRVINGDCHILFLRKKDAPTQSLVTIEVKNGKIVQAFQAYNRMCNEAQNEAIEAFNKKFSKEK